MLCPQDGCPHDEWRLWVGEGPGDGGGRRGGQGCGRHGQEGVVTGGAVLQEEGGFGVHLLCMEAVKGFFIPE